jgi:hypothetical protein
MGEGVTLFTSPGFDFSTHGFEDIAMTMFCN